MSFSWGSGGALSPISGPGQSPGGVLEAKPPEAPEILYFTVLEIRLKIHIFPVCCNTETQGKVIKIATQCLGGVYEPDFGFHSHVEKTYYQNRR